MPIRPILASLSRHRIPALLIVLEIALTFAVLCNAVFVIRGYVASMSQANHIDEKQLIVVSVNGLSDDEARSAQPRNLAALRAIAGVQAAANVTSMPLDGNPTLGSFTVKPMQQSRINTSTYYLGAGSPQVLGLHLLQGRFFNDAEYANGGFDSTGYQSNSDVVLITRSDAQRLWPGQNPLGQLLYNDRKSWTVIGVVDDVLGMSPVLSGVGGTWSSVFFPLHADPALTDYVLHTSAQDRDRVLAQARDRLAQLEPGAVIDAETFSDMRSDYYVEKRDNTIKLLLLCVVMLAVTAFGIVGLTSFWVGQRRTQIGIRRALGATRVQIMQYFQLENFLLSSAGLLLGSVLAYGLSLYLMHQFETELLPWWYLAIGVAVLWLLGQLATLGPALRAAAIPPVVAIRQA